MPLYRKKGKYPISNNVGSVCKSLPFRFWELFPVACLKVKATHRRTGTDNVLDI